MTPEVKCRLAQVIYALRAGETIEGRGDDVDKAVAHIIARQWAKAQQAGKGRRSTLPSGSRRVRGWVGGEKVDAAIPAEVVEAAEIVGKGDTE